MRVTRRTLLGLGLGGSALVLVPARSQAALNPGWMPLTAAPINTTHRLASGLIGLFVNHRAYNGGGTVWRNLVRGGFNLTLTTIASPPTATSGWSQITTHRGGYGEMRSDGVGDTLTSPDSTLWTGMNAITVSCWVKITTLHATAEQIVIRKQHSVSPFMTWSLYLFDPTPNKLFAWNVADTAATQAFIWGNTPVVASTWYHLTGTARSSTPSEFYRYGRRDTGTVASLSANALFDSDSPVVVFSDAGGSPMDGAIDHVAIWRRMLSAREALEWYRESSAGLPTLLNWVRPEVHTQSAGSARVPTRGRLF